MAKIDYTGIEEEIQKILDEGLANVSVTIETEQPMEAGPWVSIFIDRRDRHSSQQVAAGTRLRFALRFSIWCWQWSLESRQAVSRLRDELLTEVEAVLMKNPKLNNKVETSRIEGGEFGYGRRETEKGITGLIAHMSGGEIILVADVLATT